MLFFMLTVHEHLTRILTQLGPVAPLDVVLADAAGCILADAVHSAGPVPPAAVAATDGYAVRAEDTGAAAPGHPVQLRVVQDVLVADSVSLPLSAGQAARIDSGAVLPSGADAVIPLSYTSRELAVLEVSAPVAPDTWVRAAGTDLPAASMLLPAGLRLGPRQISLAAAAGLRRVTVHPKPRVVVIAVGAELKNSSRGRSDAARAEANADALITAITEAEGRPVFGGVVGDDRAELRQIIDDYLVRADLIITTGGLSEGDHDTVGDVLGSLGTVRLDQVALSPCGRQAFGEITALEEDTGLRVPVLGLPGHPVAALTAFEVFVRPALRSMAGRTEIYRRSVSAQVTRGWASPEGLRQFVPGVVSGSPTAGYGAEPLDTALLPSLAAMSQANALVVVPEQQTQVQEGDTLHVMALET